MINLTIDGKQIEVQEGTTVLRAATSAGIEIPTLCDHPHLTPYGGCRLCLVEVEGARTLQPSCTLPVTNNMVVKTNTKKVLDARKFVLTLIFSERNHFCPYCQVSGGDCELQNAAYNEGMTHWPLQPNWKPYPVDASHPYIILENNRCILCRRCVRACGELIGNYTLGFEERGAKSILVADTGVPLGESTCISCGSCVQVCPTGALIDRWSAYLGHETAFDTTQTICVGCSIGCGINVLSRDNNLVRIEGDWNAEVNGGVICEVGRFLPMIDKCDRIHTPMIRKNGALKAATWDEAIETIAGNLSSTGNDIAAMISPRQPVEALYSFKQLFTQLGATRLSTTDENGLSLPMVSFAVSRGKPYESSLSDLEASDGVMVYGVDLIKDYQVAGFFIKRNLSKGTGLLVVDETPNGLDKFANKSLRATKGNLELVVEGISAAIKKLGLAKGTMPSKTSDLEIVAKDTGYKSDDYLDAAYILGAAQNPVIVYDGKANLALLKSLADLVGAKLVSLKGKANSLAAAQFALEDSWKSNSFKSVVLALGDGDVNQKMAKDLEKIPFKVVIASYSSTLTANADVVLPACTWLEQGGHYINNDGKVLEAKAALKAEAEVVSVQEAVAKISGKLGIKLDTNWKKVIQESNSPVEITL